MKLIHRQLFAQILCLAHWLRPSENRRLSRLRPEGLPIHFESPDSRDKPSQNADGMGISEKIK
jgi:hypothetical protein